MALRLKLHHKLVAAFFLFALVSSGLSAYILIQAAKNQVLQDIRLRISDIAAIAAKSIDSEKHADLTQSYQEGSPKYLEIKHQLQKIRNASSDVHYIYTMRKGPDQKIIFVVDGTEDPKDIAHLGEVYDDASPLLRSSFEKLDHVIVEKGFYTDEWGTWLSAYAPIFRSDGRREGVLGVDISAKTVLAYEKRLFLYATAAFGLIIPIILFASYMLGRSIVRPVTRMIEGAEKIGHGDLDIRFEVNRKDEIGTLAHTLNEMAESLGRSRKEVEEIAQKYRQIFENASEGIFQSTIDGKPITSNPSMAKILGHDSTESLLRSITNIAKDVYSRPEDREEIINQLKKNGRVDAVELPLKRKDGSEIWVSMNVHITREEDGQEIIEGMVQDITERLNRAKAELDRQAAEAANEAKSGFLAHMSHEIRTPLNAVMGLTDLIMRTDLSEKQREYMLKVKSAASSLLAVINDILDFSKIEAGRLELEQTNFSLHEVMANLTEIFGHKAHEKEIELMVTIAPDVPCALVGDKVRLGQVLINLVGNAIKFTEKGEIIVAVSLDPDNKPSSKSEVALLFNVSDTGSGIPEDRLDAIFHSFSQADSSVTRKHGGTGLGLAICKKLVEMMGGKIKVTSTPGQGSLFSFTALFKEAEEKTDLQNYKQLNDIKGLNVLVVDDNKTAREILAGFITSFKMIVQTAASGKEALNIIENSEKPFDLILLDWKMPGLNGTETAKLIRKSTGAKSSPIICMVSAYGREDLLQQAEKSTIDAFLHKPVNQSFLFDTIMGLFHSENRQKTDVTAISTGTEVLMDWEGIGLRILLVEDNEINQDVAREWLESAGFKVEIASNGKDAVDMVKSSDRFDAVLMDIQMPEMDGYRATRHIRKIEERENLPIIAMTAHALKGDREKCIDAGMNDYVTKPIDPRLMFQALARWLPQDGKVPAVDLVDSSEMQILEKSEHTFNINLPGIDTDIGLFRANNKPELYLKLLKSFLRDFSNAPEKIMTFLDQEMFDDARRVAHSVKGVSANIGANELSELASQLEQSIESSNFDLHNTLWREFKTNLVQVTEGIEHNLEEENLSLKSASYNKNAATVKPPDQVLKHLKELEMLLDEDILAARELVDDMAADIVALTGKESLTRLTTSMEELDIDGAIETVQKMLNKIDESNTK